MDGAEGTRAAGVGQLSGAERYSGLSHTTLWRYVTSGELKAARIGRSVRIHLPSLRDFMERAAEG